MAEPAFLLGVDVGSSSVKVSLLDARRGVCAAAATAPKTELAIHAPKPGWAEQDPHVWWDSLKDAVSEIRVTHGPELSRIAAIGVSYQMHGLVLIDRGGRVLRPSIIWCDSRAVPIGEAAFAELGPDRCLTHLLNSPGNFTASKLAWVRRNEPEVYERVWKLLLPGDYLAFRLTGKPATTVSGLSEALLWDAAEEGPAGFVLDHYGLSSDLLPDIVPTFGPQGQVSREAAAEAGLPPGIPVAYRAGDQPNNAFSLGVLEPGELAATAGTSGVVYGIVGRPVYDKLSRVNTFVHVNHKPAKPRFGVLLCLNGAGILNRWLRDISRRHGYAEMNDLALEVPPGSDGLRVLPYGNGAERTLGNRDPGASIHGLNFNIHSKAHLFRAGQEGIVFALAHGLGIMREMGLSIGLVRAGHANMFLSPVFAEAFATVTGAEVRLYQTDGAEGAARGAGIGAGVYPDLGAAFERLSTEAVVKPNTARQAAYEAAFADWRADLSRVLG